MDTASAILITVIGASTPLLLAALGELVSERAGVLNLGVEGMMLAGAVVGFATTVSAGTPYLGLLAAAFAGAAMAFLFAALTVWLATNQVATGLALTIFGIGLSSLVGTSFVGMPAERLPRLDLFGLRDLPLVGELLFGHDLLVYLSLVLLALCALVLRHTRVGMILRACGENDASAHALGHPVLLVRFLAVLFGGACAGLAGAYVSLALTPMWVEGMSAGRGWIAIALVVFAAWRPWRLLVGAYLFGGVSVLQLHAQGAGFAIPSELMSMAPYVATIVVLVVIAAGPFRGRLDAPACLGKPFQPSR